MTETAAASEIVRDLAFKAAEPKRLEPGKVYAWASGDRVQQLDLTGDQFFDFPRRKRGTVTVTDVDSFRHYHGRHADPDSEVFADLDGATVTAVLDAHRKDGTTTPAVAARWQQHRLILALLVTQPWQDWTARDGKLMDQPTFAEFVEDHAKDVIAPHPKAVTSADLLEVAQNFQTHTSVQFKSGHRVASGQTQLEYVEQTSAATKPGTIDIPNEFSLGIKPFEDCDPMVVRARFRYRLAGGNLTLGFKLDDAQGIAREAVKEVTAKLAEACGVTVMHGKPA